MNQSVIRESLNLRFEIPYLGVDSLGITIDIILPENHNLGVADRYLKKHSGRLRPANASPDCFRYAAASKMQHNHKQRKHPLIDELAQMRQQIAALETWKAEQIQAREALQEREELFTNIFYNSPIAILLYDGEGQIIKVNRACLNMVGMSDVGDTRRWPGLFDDPWTPYEAKEALRRGEVVRYQASVNYDKAREVGGYEGTRSGVCFIDVLTIPLGRESNGVLKGYMVQIQDVTDRKQAEVKLRAYQEHLRSLASQLSIVEERERRRLAVGLHDQIGQTLAMIKIKLGAIRDVSPGADLRNHLDEVRALIDEAIQETRSLTFELSPPILYELGLEAALEWLVEQFQARYRICCKLETDGQPKLLEEDTRGVLFQAARELLMNVVRHAQAQTAKVSVQRLGNNISISVADDGIGFDMSCEDWKTRGFGLFNIRERLAALGGRLEIRSKPGHGTLVTIELSLGHDKKAERGLR